MAGKTVFTLGQKFNSFKELEDKIKSYQNERYVQLYRRDSRSIKAAQKRTPKKAVNVKPELVYAYLEYCCIHGGKKFKSESAGTRPNQRLVVS